MTGLDPDQILKSLDAEIAAARFRRSTSGNPNRNVIRMAGILFLVLGTAAALFALQYMASEFAGRQPPPKTAQQQQPSSIGADGQ
jgi:hypothetical protein